jgi:hypothetical protein
MQPIESLDSSETEPLNLLCTDPKFDLCCYECSAKVFDKSEQSILSLVLPVM